MSYRITQLYSEHTNLGGLNIIHVTIDKSNEVSLYLKNEVIELITESKSGAILDISYNGKSMSVEVCYHDGKVLVYEKDFERHKNNELFRSIFSRYEKFGKIKI